MNMNQETLRLLFISFIVPTIGAIVGYFVQSDSSDFLFAVSVLTIAILIFTLGTIRAAGVMARSSRPLLLYVFRPGLFFAQFVSAALVILSGSISIISIYSLEAHFIGRVHFILLAGLGFAAIGGALRVLRACFTPFKPTEAHVFGKALSKSDHPQLWGFASAIAKDIGTAPPDNIIAGFDPNFFVTEAGVICLDGKLQGRTLYLSLPFCRVLTILELGSIIGHEFGHFTGQDTRYSRKFFPIYRGSVETLQIMGAHVTTNGAHSLAFLPSLCMISFFLNAFSLAESEISRDRELEADRAGAKITNNLEMARALLKVHAYSKVWEFTALQMRELLKAGNRLTNASEYFSKIAVEVPPSTLFSGLEHSHTAHPTDSHPPLDLRLVSLGAKIEDVAKSCQGQANNEIASSLFNNATSLETELSDLEHYKLIKQGQVPVGNISKKSA